MQSGAPRTDDTTAQVRTRQSEAGPSKERIDALQYLRALAAIAVMLSHTIGDIAYHGGPDLFRYYYVGAAGVDLFFVISGFVMVYTAAPLFGAPGGWSAFLLRRFARVVPLYWVATGAYCLVQIGHGSWDVVRPDLVIASLLFWPYSDGAGLHLPVYSIGWTLDFEMFFYAAFALALPLRRTFGLLALLGGLGALVGAGAFAALPGPLRFWSQPVLLDFLLGLGLGLAHLRGWRMPHTLGLGACVLAALLLTGSALLGFNAVPNAPEAFPRWVAWGIPAALLLAGTTLAHRRSRSRLAWPLAFGDASYAIYLLHPLVIITARPIMPRITASVGAVPGSLCYLSLVTAMVLAGALALHVGFERPTQRLMLRIPAMHRFRKAAPTASVYSSAHLH